jgi:hypothetical protein
MEATVYCSGAAGELSEVEAMSGPGLELHTYVMMRLNRWVIYAMWSADLLTRKPGPRSVKSWWHTMITAVNVKQQRTPIVQRVPCPVDDVECGITDL